MELWRERNVGTIIYFPLIDRGTLDFESTPVTFVAADTQFSVDGGVFANTTNIPVHEGNGIYSLTLVAAEVNGQNTVITIIDAATKLWEDQAMVISTYGDTSAEHAVNLNDSVRAGLTALPNAAAEALGGLYTRGFGTGQIGQGSNGLVDINVVEVRGSTINILVSGRVDASVGAMAADVLTAAALASDAADEIVDQVWDEAKAGHVAVGSFGEEVQAHALETTLVAQNDVSPAEVNAEVLDVMNVDTYPEPGQGLPPATTTIFTKINHLYKNWRNKKEETATEFRLFNDAGTVVDAKATVSDGAGLTTKEEFVTGP